MPDTPKTQFARNGDVHIAYQRVGGGSLDLLVVDTWVHHVEAVWEFPGYAGFLRRLGSVPSRRCFSPTSFDRRASQWRSERVCMRVRSRSAAPDVGGLAVHIAARVAGLADGGEVLVSNTVKDLLAGSATQFHELGGHQLKGVPGTWRLFAAMQP